MKNTVTITLPVHQQGSLIYKVLTSITTNMSDHVRELFVVLDTCTDNRKMKFLGL
jgi:hypothetical protein